MPMKKGFIAFIPVFVVAAAISLASIGAVASQRNKPLEKGSILSSSNSNGDNEDKSGSNNNSKESSNKSSENSRKSEIKSESKSDQNKSKSETMIDQENGNLKIHTKTKIEGGSEEEFELESENKKNEDENEIEDEDEGTKSATRSVRPGRKIRSNFPNSRYPLLSRALFLHPDGNGQPKS